MRTPLLTTTMRSARLWRGAAALALLWTLACAAEEPLAAIARDAFAPPDVAGPYRVHRRELPDGLGSLYLPSDRQSAAAPALFPLDLVLFAPGFSSSEEAYRGTLQHLASHGLAVIGAQHGFDFVSASFCSTQRDGYRRVGDALQAVRELSAAGAELDGLLEGSRLATAGHSFGGKLALWRASEEPAVAAVVALDPVDGGDERRPGWCPQASEGFPRLVDTLPAAAALPPSFYLSAGQAGECAPAAGNAFALVEAQRQSSAPGPIWHLQLLRAGHQDFVDAAADALCPGCSLCPESGEQARTVQRLARGVLVAFLRWQLQDDDRYERWLRPTGEEDLMLAPPAFVLEAP